jgi:hypothetical protein
VWVQRNVRNHNYCIKAKPTTDHDIPSTINCIHCASTQNCQWFDQIILFGNENNHETLEEQGYNPFDYYVGSIPTANTGCYSLVENTKI